MGPSNPTMQQKHITVGQVLETRLIATKRNDNKLKTKLGCIPEVDEVPTDVLCDPIFNVQTPVPENREHKYEDEEHCHYVFMYNFFLRKNCKKRMKKYLLKVEEGKNAKIRHLISKVRSLPLNNIYLPVEKIGPYDAKIREQIKARAHHEIMVDQQHTNKIMQCILGIEQSSK